MPSSGIGCPSPLLKIPSPPLLPPVPACLAPFIATLYKPREHSGKAAEAASFLLKFALHTETEDVLLRISEIIPFRDKIKLQVIRVNKVTGGSPGKYNHETSAELGIHGQTVRKKGSGSSW